MPTATFRIGEDMPRKTNDEAAADAEKTYRETGELPEGWTFDPVAESRGEAGFRRAGDKPEPTGTPAEPEPDAE